MFKKILFYWKAYTQEIEKYPIFYSDIKHEIMKRWPKCDLEITDLQKRTCDYDTLKGLASLIPVKHKRYEKEIFDCEDFTIIAWGIWKAFFPRLPIGFCLMQKGNSKHAVNCAIYKTKRGFSFTMIEPQTGKVSYTNWIPYKIII